ncbi:MAG TPA: zinc-ribbon domain-containing protein [Anaerohalosphaeraceae bacterium]|nr:zinc-ribbon domain-containing protein [Phycisphaerae bacterium]HOK95602.1 zinc-ribbon domain-containing protein [Anaerohalosphaeraceae bacterium]HOL30927.1 zinc-ribbon domain-containing protein [Anaerohalosphaeraceae bacterium]HOM76280.1 zinc-ribbon domain-containing protein [Anaerohalosphaeraceae bacterium]HPC65130.1 zinc-ribbon domain-containing protein [Anaerohalosphaeraceae bacterium]
MAKQISQERKSLYNAGLAVMIAGGCFFALPFLAVSALMAIMVISFGKSQAGIPIWMPIAGPIVMFVSFIGIALIVAGCVMRSIAARGTAGSGLVLNPEKAREDLKPWTGMAGGMVKDILEEADIKSAGARQTVMIRCPHCQKLNEEDSKFCQECGKSL